MNTNGHIPTMYESIPAVAALNRVPGFDPLKLLRRIVSPENGEEMLQLDLRYKKLWFRLANPRGRIRLNPLSITEQMAIFEAQVFLDRSDENPVGSFTSGCRKEDAPEGRYIQAAQFEAMDEALTDAGFGVQFADVSTDKDGCRYGSRISLIDKMPAGQDTAAASGTETLQKAGAVQSAGQAGNTVKQLPGAVSGSAGTVNNRVNTVQAQKAAGNIQKGQQEAAKTLAAYAGTAVSGSSKQSGKAAGDSRGAEIQGAPPVMAQDGRTAVRNQAAQNGLPAQTPAVKAAGVQQAAAAQGQRAQAVGSARAFHPVLAQRQGTQASGDGKGARLPEGQKQPDNQPVGKTESAQSVKSGFPVQPRDMDRQPVRDAAADTAITSANTAESDSLPVQPGNAGTAMKEVAELPVSAAESCFLPVQPGTMQKAIKAEETLPADTAGSGSLPVQPETMKTAIKAMETLTVNAAESDTLPIQPGTAGTAQETTGVLPVNAVQSQLLPAQSAAIGSDVAARGTVTVQAAEKAGGTGQLRNSVRGAMALLSGQKLPASNEAASTGKVVSMESNAAGSPPAISQDLAQGAPAPRYTADMPVEEIVKLMTLEEAGKVVVGAGVCKGMTIAEVAERRTPSLKFYRYGGYKGDDNILRAAAQIMLDSMEAAKAS